MMRTFVVVLAFMTAAAKAQTEAPPQTDPAPNAIATPASMPAQDSPPTTAAATQPAGGEQELDEYRDLVIGNNAPASRRLGARKLLEKGGPEALRRLVAILSQPNNVASRLAVCEAVAEFERPPPELLDPLISLALTDSVELADAVTRALKRFDSEAVSSRLRAAASDETADARRRAVAIRALGAAADDLGAVVALVEFARSDDPATRTAALEALSAATGERFETADAAAAWWQSMGAMTPTDWLRFRSSRQLQKIRRLEAERDALARRLVASFRERFQAFSEADRLKLLTACMEDDLAALRELALELVNTMITDRKEIGPEIRDLLPRLISDPAPAVRGAAAKLAGDLRVSAATVKLIEAMPREPNREVRAAQVSALGKMDDAATARPLIERLSDESPVVVREAALALAALARRGNGHPDVVAPASAALTSRFRAIPSEDAALREAFLTAMTTIGAEEFLAVFRAELAEDRPVLTRQAAIRGLAVFPGTAAEIRPLVSAKDVPVRLTAVEALGRCGADDDDLAALAERLETAKEPDQPVQARAWESFKLIAARMSTEAQVRASQRFAVPQDRIAQRRRLELLRAAEPQFAQMRPGPRSEALERLAEANFELGEFEVALTRLDQAIRAAAEDPSRAAALTERADAVRRAQVSALLDAVVSDPEAEKKLEALGADRVLPALCERFARVATGTQPADGAEFKLVQVARQLVPDWPGYGPDATAEVRAAAIQSLRERCGSLVKGAAPEAATTAPAP